MKKYCGKLLLVSGILALLIGCSADRAQLVSQPSAERPGDTIPVVLSDVYVIVSTTESTTVAYQRDSIHVVYGLPAGWSVVSSNYYVASALKINQIASIATDSALLLTLLQDSLATYTSRESAMKADPSWKSYFSHKTLSAHGFGTDSIPVNVDSVGQWQPYAAKIGLNFPKGTPMDTSLAVSSLPIDTSSIPSVVKLLYGNVKTIWVKTIPIVCFARIAVGQSQNTFNLYYFTKTAGLPSSTQSLIPNFDKGDMTYAPININSNNAVKLAPALLRACGLLRITAGQGRVTLFSLGGDGGTLSICDMEGRTIRSFGAPAQGPIAWDGTNTQGLAAGAGNYVARYRSDHFAVTQTFHFVR